MRVARLDELDRYDAVCISPHLDDVALSCAGRVLDETDAGRRVLVVTLFSAPWKRRKREDARACARLAADHVHVGLRDAPFRSPRYRAFSGILFGEPDGSDAEAVARAREVLVDVLERAAPEVVLAPLGIGEHVDHRLTHDVVRGLGLSNVEHYEDRPYAEVNDSASARLVRLGAAVRGEPHEPWPWPRLVALGGDLFRTRHVQAMLSVTDLPLVLSALVRVRRASERPRTLRATPAVRAWGRERLRRAREVVACHASQVPPLFGDLDGWEQHVRRASARIVLDAAIAERTWTLEPRRP